MAFMRLPTTDIYEDGLDQLPINASPLNEYRRIMKRFWSRFF